MKLKPPLIASIGALLLVGALFLSLVLSTAAYRTGDQEIMLPSEATKAPKTEENAGRNLEIVSDVKITAENIQRVIASLSRSDQYIASVTSHLYYGDDSGIVMCRQSVRNNAFRVDYLSPSGTVVHTQLLWNDSCYAWRSGSSTYYHGARGDFTADQDAMLPTYETVCNLPADQITGGSLVQEGNEMRLVVDTRDGSAAATYQISVRTGLLCAAAFSENGVTTRSLDVQLSSEEPDDSLFILPGETIPVYAGKNQGSAA